MEAPVLYTDDKFVIEPFTYPAEARLDEEPYETVNLCILAEGACWERRNGVSVLINQPNLTINQPDTKHSFFILTPGIRGVSIDLNMGWLNRLEPAINVGEPLQNLRMKQLLPLTARIQQELYGPDTLTALAVESYVIQLLIEAHRVRNKPTYCPPWFKRIVEHIKDDPTAAYSLSELAKEADVHPTHLARMFRLFASTNLTDFIRTLRLEKSLTLLVNEELTIADIALSCGFFDQSHFSRYFSRWYGITPGEYRKRNKC